MTAAPSAPAPAWRPMQQADLQDVSAIAARVHPDYPEDDAIFAERLRLYPAGCRVLAAGAKLYGYVLSHPWRAGQVPKLNTLLGDLPAEPDTYYIHDIALLPEVRGLGCAGVVVAELVARARVEKLNSMSLVAVNCSTEFWQRHGFGIAAAQTPAHAVQLKSYDGHTTLMTRQTR